MDAILLDPDEQQTRDEPFLSRRDLLLRAGGAAMGLSLLSPVFARAETVRSIAQEATVANLRWALTSAPTSLDVSRSFNGNTLLTMFQTAESLVGYSSKQDLVPVLASKVEMLTSRKYVYTLRSGVRFSNGASVTADDVVYSLRRNLLPTSQVSLYFSNVASVVKTGPNEVTVNLKKPDLLFRFAPILAPIVPRALAEAEGANFGAPGNPWVSTGPFMVETFDRTSLVLVPNPHYRAKKPSVKRITFSVINNPQTLRLAMGAGDIDGTFAVAMADTRQWENVPGVDLTFRAGLLTGFLAFDMSQSPWNDLRIRRAFVYAYDSRSIVRTIFQGGASQAKAIVPSQMWQPLLGRRETAKLYKQLPSYPFNLTKARAELRQLSAPNGFDVTLSIPSHHGYAIRPMQIYAESLKEIGINLRLQSVTASEWLANVYGHKDLGLQFLTLAPEYLDPENYMLLLRSENAVPNKLNIANYRNAKVDTLLSKQRSAPADDRVRYLTEVLMTAGRDVPYLPLWWLSTAVALRENLKMLHFNAFYALSQWSQEITSR